jgi:prevent-host-death family protein
MKKRWQLQEAKNRFSQLVEDALREGAQTVTRHGKDAVVVLSMDEYRKLVAPGVDLVAFLARSPLKGLKLDVRRSREAGRKVEL